MKCVVSEANPTVVEVYSFYAYAIPKHLQNV